MNDTFVLGNHIHALLFTEGGTLSIQRICEICSTDRESILRACESLHARISHTGLTIVMTETEISLVANAQESAFLRDVHHRELGESIGDAGLEVLATILYRDGATKSEIDYIRGVNTATTLRSLLSRGLIERRSIGPRQFTYHATADTLAHLGVRSREELPEYQKTVETLAQYIAEHTSHDVFAATHGTE